MKLHYIFTTSILFSFALSDGNIPLFEGDKQEWKIYTLFDFFVFVIVFIAELVLIFVFNKLPWGMIP
jgi:hypothetical protein